MALVRCIARHAACYDCTLGLPGGTYVCVFIVLAAVWCFQLAGAILAFPQVKHTYDIVNKNGDITTTVVFGEVSAVHGLHAVVSSPSQHPHLTVLVPSTFAYGYNHRIQ